MARVVFYEQAEDFGLPVIEIQPKARATFRFVARDLTVVRRAS